MAPLEVQWPALLKAVLKEKGAAELPEPKAVKYAVKYAQILHGEASKGALKAGLRAYLARCGRHPTLGDAHSCSHGAYILDVVFQCGCSWPLQRRQV